jgi:CRP-like cAMP-binding protein
MQQLVQSMRQMISISDSEIENFCAQLHLKTFKRNAVVSKPGVVPNEILFINRGLIRLIMDDHQGEEQTIHFALENRFIADYSAFIRQQPSLYTLQTTEETEVVVMPRTAIEWGYAHLQEGQKMGRLIAEYYFIYQDHRIQNAYARTPKQRYDSIAEVFPSIHNRVPQHMIASYLGITSVHLSRLKKAQP